MNFEQFKIISYCVGQKTLLWYKKNIIGEITFSEKTGKEIKVTVGQCSLCKIKNFDDC